MARVYLKRGDRGEEVRLLQKAICLFGKNITGIGSFDGSFGPTTELALKRFQSQNALPMTGVYDQDTHDLLAPNIDAAFIRLSDMDDYASDMAVEPAALKAVYTVESKGDGYLTSGDPVILFEGHIFYRLYERKFGTSRVQQLTRQYPDIVYKDWTSRYYRGGAGEHTRLATAMEIDQQIAWQSASWGLFQIMGFNYSSAGYVKLSEFINAMYQSEHEQFYAGCSFIRSNPKMHKALRDKDWPTFARLYNGPGYAQNQYDTKLARAYTNHR